MAFQEVLFPTDIAYGSSGGPTRRTEIVILDSGFEERNTSWASSRHRFNISYGVKTYDQLETLITFWQARSGPLNGFRFKDFADFRSKGPQTAITDTDQLLGVGDGANQTFQLIKTYSSGGSSYVRTINKPTSSTTIISLDDVSQASGWSVDITTGIVTFTSAPGADVDVKAGFEFEVPTRFESDEVIVNLEAFNHGTLEDIILIEVRV